VGEEWSGVEWSGAEELGEARHTVVVLFSPCSNQVYIGRDAAEYEQAGSHDDDLGMVEV
jgi:hypothetical protein